MIVLLTVTSVSLVALWGCATFLVPQHVNSLFRYELWQVRDELHDYVYRKRLPQSDLVMLLISATEIFIRFSDLVCLTEFVGARLAHVPLDYPNESLLLGLPETERALLTPYIDRITDSLLSKMVLGGPFGWIPFLVQQAIGFQRFARLVFWAISPAKRKSVDEERRKAELRKLRQLQEVVTWKAAKQRYSNSLADYAA
jgi:hypothetical protein